jgi:hypothetical protein
MSSLQARLGRLEVARPSSVMAEPICARCSLPHVRLPIPLEQAERLVRGEPVVRLCLCEPCCGGPAASVALLTHGLPLSGSAT